MANLTVGDIIFVMYATGSEYRCNICLGNKFKVTRRPIRDWVRTKCVDCEDIKRFSTKYRTFDIVSGGNHIIYQGWYRLWPK